MAQIHELTRDVETSMSSGGDGETMRTSTRPFVCPFESCEKSFTKKYNLKTHIRIHTKERPYACECSLRYMYKSSLAKHKLRCPYLRRIEEQEQQRTALKPLSGNRMSLSFILGASKAVSNSAR
mmetsp:Transcript_4051/g.12176  ORF Transcript_4051/g.12176 Transcript_4051/m.12176 type:complete len:124 (+) Transcript_4051:216-587(+)